MNQLLTIHRKGVERMKDKLTGFLKNEDFQIASKTQKQISKLLVYFLNAFTRFSQQNPLLALLKQAIKVVDSFVESTEYRKYGQNLNYFGFVVRQYQKVACSNSQLSNQELALARNAKNEEQCYYKSVTETQISKSQIVLLRSSSSSCFFCNINTNQLRLQNYQCIGCSSNLYKNLPILNLNPQFCVVVGLESFKAFDTNFLQKYLSAVCNQGGGIILIGVENKGNILKPVGIRFQNQEMIRSCQRIVFQAANQVKPNCQVVLHRVFVKENYESPNNKDLLCFRISVFSNPSSQITFLEQERKGKTQENYKFYSFNNNLELESMLPAQVYGKMHELYKKVKRSISSHKNISCLNPSQTILSVSTIVTDPPFLESGKEPELEDEDWLSQEVLPMKPNGLPFKSILKISSVTHEKVIKKIKYFLLENNEEFIFQKPFKDIFLKSTRFRWVIDHSLSHKAFANVIGQFMKEENIQKDAFSLIPVEQILKIDSENLKDTERDLKGKLVQQFHHEVCYKQGKCKKKKNHFNKESYLKFSDIEMSLFSYMFFQQMSLTSYFINLEHCPVNF